MYLEHLQLKSQPFAEHAMVSALWQDQRMPPLLKKLLDEYSATGTPPAYLPKTPASEKGEAQS